jgi:hypothetical protein
MTHLPSTTGPARPTAAQQARQAHCAYVIEIGETQAGLVNRRADERYFTFISASSAFHALEGHRFATPGAAELAARQLARPHRT